MARKDFEEYKKNNEPSRYHGGAGIKPSERAKTASQRLEEKARLVEAQKRQREAQAAQVRQYEEKAAEVRQNNLLLYGAVGGLYNKYGLSTGSQIVSGNAKRLEQREMQKQLDHATEMSDIYTQLYGSGKTNPEQKTEALEQKNRFDREAWAAQQRLDELGYVEPNSVFVPDYAALPMKPGFDIYAKMGESMETELRPEEIEGSYTYFDLLSDEEQGVFNYLLATQGEESARNYMDFMKNTAQHRYGQRVAQGIEDSDWRTGALIANSLGTGVTNWLEGMLGAYGAATGQEVAENGLNYASPYIKENLGTVGNVAYDLGVTVGNMLPSVMLGGAAGNVSMGLSAGGNAYQQGIREGMSNSEALVYGSLIGASEAYLQRAMGGISRLGGAKASKLDDALRGIENGFLRFISKTGVGMVKEGGEEALQAALEPMFNSLITGSDVNIDWSEVAYNALMGALMGGAFEAPQNLVETVLTEGKDAMFAPTAEKPQNLASKWAMPANNNVPAEAANAAEIRPDSPGLVQAREQLRQSTFAAAEKSFGKEGYAAFEAQAQAMDNPADNFGEMARAYNDGMVNRHAASYGSLSSAQYEAMFEAGKADAEASIASQMDKRNKVFSYKDAGIDMADAVTKEYSATLDARDAKTLNAAAKAFGLKIRFADSVAGGAANAEIRNGVITIEKGNPKPLRSLFGHEVTHRMQELAPQEYARLREAAAATGDWLDAKVRKTIANYNSKGRSISREAAMDEAIADYMGEIIENSDELERFIARFSGERTLLQKLRDVIRDIAVALSGSEQAKRLRAVEKRLSEAMEAAAKQAQSNAGATKNAAQTSDGGAGKNGALSLKDRRTPTYAELIAKPDMTIVDISKPLTAGTFAERRRQILENSDAVIKTPYLNKDTNTRIFLTKNSYSHAFSNKGEYNINAVERFPELIKNAVLTHAESSTHGNENAIGVYTFFAAAKTNAVQPVKLKVKEIAVNGQNLPQNIKAYFEANPKEYAEVYDSVVLEVLEIEESPRGSALPNQPRTVVREHPQGLSTIKVADLLALVKGKEEKYIPKSQVVDNVKVEKAVKEGKPISTTDEVLFSLKNDSKYMADAMRDSVLYEGQPQYSLKDSDTLVRDIVRIQREGVKNKRSDADIQADIRAAVQEAYQSMVDTFGAIEPGENAYREVQVPSRTAKKKKVSKTARTAMEAQTTPDEALPKMEELVATGEFSYEVYGDKAALKDAREYIQEKGWAGSLAEWLNDVRKGNVSKRNTAVGWMLYDNAVNSGDVETAMTILNAMVEHQRSAAQAVQATRLLKKLSPETQLYGVQRSVASLQREINDRHGKDSKTELVINQALAEDFLRARTDEQRDEALKEIYRDIGRQMPSTFIDKFRAWRYLAMLGNPRTHGRNVAGNAAFAPVVLAKDITASAIEAAVYRVSGGKTGRSKTLSIKQGVMKAAWQDYKNVADMVSGEGKYSDYANANRYIEEGRQVFKFAPLEKARRGNTKALEAEDMWFSQPHYAFALAQYCSVNGISAEQIRSGKGLDKAREYAAKEAQKATYRDTNQFSQAISHMGFKTINGNMVKKGVNAALEGVLPFRKTPANILVRGLEYSPLGLVNGIKQAVWDVQKGNMTAAEAIDNISAGLTGTGLLALGVYLAAQGLIRGRGSDDENEKEFEELMGHQSYALETPDGKSYTLDWLAPEALPFFIGVNLYEQVTAKRESQEAMQFKDVMAAVWNVTEPMLSMSCLQSLNDLFEAVGYASSNDMNGLMTVLSTAATSYLSQALPTIAGQIERIGEAERMTTYTEKNSPFSNDMQYFFGRVSGKTPGEFQQIPYIDAWGHTESTGGFGERAFNNLLNPAYSSRVEMSPMEEMLLQLYKDTGEGSVLPGRAGKYFNVGEVRKDLTAEEYVKYATEKGQLSYNLLTGMMVSEVYMGLSSADQVDAVEKVYEYANAIAKTGVSNYKLDGWVAKANKAIAETNVKPEVYIPLYIAQGNIESLKDKDGKTISNSKSLQVMQLVYSVPGLTDKQRKALFEAFDVSEGIRHYNRTLVEQKLREMQRKAR